MTERAGYFLRWDCSRLLGNGLRLVVRGLCRAPKHSKRLAPRSQPPSRARPSATSHSLQSPSCATENPSMSMIAKSTCIATDRPCHGADCAGLCFRIECHSLRRRSFGWRLDFSPGRASFLWESCSRSMITGRCREFSRFRDLPWRLLHWAFIALGLARRQSPHLILTSARSVSSFYRMFHGGRHS